jgi:sulfite exporter TauE/SafE
MIELPLIFLGGLLGSAHCVGMCGGFAMSLGLGARSVGANVYRQLIYTSGRIFTYSFLGVCAGYAGWSIAIETGRFMINAQAALCVLAGILLLAQGLISLGLIPRRWNRWLGGSEAGCLAGSFLRPFFQSPRAVHVLVAGVLTGFLPCGLVYGYLALATSSASIPGGLAIMALFGAGTGPLMIAAGASGSLVSVATRRNLLKIAAICVCLTGMLSVARGVHFMRFSRTAAPDECLYCRATGR